MIKFTQLFGKSFSEIKVKIKQLVSFIFLYEIICLYLCFYNNRIVNEKIDFFIKKYGNIFNLFYTLSLFSLYIVGLFFLYYVVSTKTNNLFHLLFDTIIYITLYILFKSLYPYVQQNPIEIEDLYKEKIFSYKMFFHGYKNKPEKIPLLFLTVNINHPFSYYEFKLLHDFLVMIRCIYSDLKTIFWFPEIIFIIILMTFFKSNIPSSLIFIVILFLISIFVFKLYVLNLLFSYFKEPIKIIISSPKGTIIDLSVERKLRKILSTIDKDGVRIKGLKLIKEFIPIFGN